MALPQGKTGPQHEKQNYIPSADPPADKQNFQLPLTSPCMDKQNICSSSVCVTDHPAKKQNDCPSFTICPVEKQNDQQTAGTKEKTALSISKNIKREPVDFKVKAEPIDLDDETNIQSHTISDDDDDDDCIIVLDVIPGDKTRKKNPKVSSAVTEVLIISDDEDNEKGDKDPSTSTTSQNQTLKETVVVETVDDSLSNSNDVQLEQVKTPTNTDAPPSLTQLPNEVADPIRKAVCEVVKELANPNPPSPSRVHNEASNLAEAKAIFSSPAADTDAPDDAAQGWTDAKDTSVPEPGKGRDLICVTTERDMDPGPEDDSEMINDGFDSDGWEVSSDDSNKEGDTEKTNTNTGHGTDLEQIVKGSDLSKRQDTVNANPQTVQITPTDSAPDTGKGNSLVPSGIPITPVDLTPAARQGNSLVPSGIPITPVDLTPAARQGNSLVPIGIIPIASEMIPGSRDVTQVIDRAETVPSIGNEVEVPSEQCGVASDHKPLQDRSVSLASACHMDGVNSLTKQAEQTIRSSVTRSKLRSCSTSSLENETSSGNLVQKNILDNPVFNCHLCFQSFKEKKLLEKHLVSHPEVTRIMCKYCNTSYQSKKGLEKHMKRCYWKRKMKKSPKKKGCSDFSIKKEKEESSAKSPKREHRKLDFTSVKKEYPKQLNVKPKAEGKICDRMLPSLRRHGQGKKDVKNPKCQIKQEMKNQKSKKKDPKDESLKDSRKRISPSSVYVKNPKCQIKQEMKNQKSKKKDPKDESLKDSRKRISPSSVYVCPKCNCTFTSMFNAKRHMHITHKITSMGYRGQEIRILPKEKAVQLIYYCITCKESFRSQFTFNSHKSSIKGRKKCERLFQCNMCYKHFEKKEHCAMHIQEHVGSTKSGKRKRASSSCNEHHSGKKKAKISEEFKCKHCDKTFEFEYLCAKHEITHTDIDPWHCFVCFKIFYLKSSITSHMDKVHKEASYCKKCFCLIASKDKRLCVDCDKRRSSSGLKCSICKTEFANPSDLTCHILTHGENGGETAVRMTPKTSVVSLKSKGQNFPQTSVSNSPQSKKRAVPVVKPSTRTYSKASLTENPTTDANASATLTCNLKTSQDAPNRCSVPSGSRSVFNCVTRSKGSRLKTEGPTVQTVHPMKHVKHNHDVCMKCGKQDIPAKDLSKHARTHLDVRSRFQCNACQQCFGDMYEIEEHGCISSKNAGSSYNVSNVVYKCQFCSRDFKNLMEARKHVLSTNTSCLLECTECKAEYSRQGDLMVHMVSIHGQYLECDKCSAQFTRQVDLDYHNKQHEDMSH